MRIPPLHRPLLAALLLALAATAAPASDILPFDELEVGMSGVGRTVWRGSRIEEFKVEIVGLLENIQPGRDLILVRCSGGSLARTGVFQGMSGSPVYIRGKLVGAVAYSFPFTTEAIGGVTPIEEMLALGEASDAPRAGATTAASLAPIFEPQGLPVFFSGLLERAGVLLRGDETAYRPLGLPLHVAGFAPQVLGDLRQALGGQMVPAGGSAPGGGGTAPAALQGGSTVGVQLIRGDLDLTAVGTVTHVEDGSVLAFGHKFLNIGATELPMTTADVHVVVPSLMSSFKVASPGEVIGTVRQDRVAGLLGRLGEGPRLIPVRLDLASEGREARTYRFELVSDPLLTPLLLNYSILSILVSAEKEIGAMTLRLGEGSSILLQGHPAVELDNFFSGDFAAPFAAGLSAYILYILMNNDYVEPQVEEVRLLVDAQSGTRSAWIEEVWADRERLRAGETVRLHVTLRPFRGDPLEEVLVLQLPRETPQGHLVVRVGDGLTLARLETKGEPQGFRPRDLDQLIWLINQIRAFNRIYANVSIVDEGLLVAGTAMPNLPPSVAQVLMMPQAGGNFRRLPRRGLLEESLATEHAVTGYRRIYLEVVP